MIEATENIKEALKEKAHDISRPFCYTDYCVVEANEDGEYFCKKCGSDDLMREVDGVGVDYAQCAIMRSHTARIAVQSALQRDSAPH